MFSRIDDNGDYSPEYKEKLKEAYRFFKAHGYEFTEHGLNRALNPKRGRGKRPFSKEDVLKVLVRPINFLDGNTRTVKYYNYIAVIQACDTQEIISVVYDENPARRWKERRG